MRPRTPRTFKIDPKCASPELFPALPGAQNRPPKSNVQDVAQGIVRVRENGHSFEVSPCEFTGLGAIELPSCDLS